MDINKKIENIQKLIDNSKSEIITILTEIESYKTAMFEISAVCETLSGLLNEIGSPGIRAKSVAVYLPLNLPLYSLVLYGLVPCMLTADVYVRPPIEITNIVKKLYNLVFSSVENLHIIELSRLVFGDGFTSCANIVIFAGQYHNALNLIKKYRTDTFIYNGAGVNPIIIANGCDLEYAIKKTIEARLFNSGQDCCAPDVIFVEADIKNKFILLLQKNLENIKVGTYKNQNTIVGPILDKNCVSFAQSFFKDNINTIIYGGYIDELNKIIYPTIVDNKIKNVYNFHEFYAPIFNIASFTRITELEHILNSSEYQDYAMCCSIFGEITLNITNTIVLKNKILLDIEGGNLPYGGYGKKASFIKKQNNFYAKPILISKEIKNILISETQTN